MIYMIARLFCSDAPGLNFAKPQDFAKIRPFSNNLLGTESAVISRRLNV